MGGSWSSSGQLSFQIHVDGSGRGSGTPLAGVSENETLDRLIADPAQTETARHPKLSLAKLVVGR